MLSFALMVDVWSIIIVSFAYREFNLALISAHRVPS